MVEGEKRFCLGEGTSKENAEKRGEKEFGIVNECCSSRGGGGMWDFVTVNTLLNVTGSRENQKCGKYSKGQERGLFFVSIIE